MVELYLYPSKFSWHCAQLFNHRDSFIIILEERLRAGHVGTAGYTQEVAGISKETS
jgi:hypothetical protein